MVDLILRDIADFTDVQYDEMYRLCGGERRKKVDELRQTDDKKMSILSYYILKCELKKRGADPEKIRVGEHGKPFVDGENIFFNISHSGKKVLVGVSDSEIGVDIQKIDDRADTEKIAKRFFSADELEYINQFSCLEKRRDAFFDIWVLKESFIKCIGTGFSTPLGSFSVITDGEFNVSSADFDGEFVSKLFRTENYSYAYICRNLDGN